MSVRTTTEKRWEMGVGDEGGYVDREGSEHVPSVGDELGRLDERRLASIRLLPHGKVIQTNYLGTSR